MTTANSSNCTCNLCGAKAHSIPNTDHRRCTGHPKSGDQTSEAMADAPVKIRAKHSPIGEQRRGTWAQG